MSFQHKQIFYVLSYACQKHYVLSYACQKFCESDQDRFIDTLILLMGRFNTFLTKYFPKNQIRPNLAPNALDPAPNSASNSTPGLGKY